MFNRPCTFDVRPCTFVQLMFSHVRTSAMFRNSICDSEESECRANCGGFESCEAENKQWRKGKRRNGHQTILCNTRWYYVIPDNTIQYQTILCNTRRYYVIPDDTKLFNTIWYCAIQHDNGEPSRKQAFFWRKRRNGWHAHWDGSNVGNMRSWGLKDADKRYVPSRKGER